MGQTTGRQITLYFRRMNFRPFAILLLFISGTMPRLMAQSDDVYTALGLDFSLPVQAFGEVAKVGIGINARFDQRIYKQFSATVGVGYTYFNATARLDGSRSDSLSSPFINYIPLKAGLKYNLSKALYVLVEAGVARTWTSNDGTDEVKRFRFCFAPGFGIYTQTPWGRFDIHARVEGFLLATRDDMRASTYFFPSLRLAYCFE